MEYLYGEVSKAMGGHRTKVTSKDFNYKLEVKQGADDIRMTGHGYDEENKNESRLLLSGKNGTFQSTIMIIMSELLFQEALK